MVTPVPGCVIGPLVDDAASCAAGLLGRGSERWRHCRGVAERAGGLAVAVPPQDRELLVAAAWVHDIGYADEDTGFHPIDGARYLQANGWDRRLAALVAHHSGARFVAHVRGLDTQTRVFEFEQSPIADALTYADQTVGPGGASMDLDERTADVLQRHGPDSPTPARTRNAAPTCTGSRNGCSPGCADTSSAVALDDTQLDDDA